MPDTSTELSNQFTVDKSKSLQNTVTKKNIATPFNTWYARVPFVSIVSLYISTVMRPISIKSRHENCDRLPTTALTIISMDIR